MHFCCDGTSMRFVVEGNLFCHLGTESCYGHTDPSRANLKSMQRLIKNKSAKTDENSYTQKLLEDKFKIYSKILEEAEELTCASEKDEMIHESTDLLYFILVYLQKHNIDIQEIESELIKRRYHVANNKFDIEIKDKNKFKIGIMTTGIPKEDSFW